MTKKIKIIAVFILGGVIFGFLGIFVYANTVSSAVVTYTSNGQSTVESALNDLYTKAGGGTSGSGNYHYVTGTTGQLATAIPYNFSYTVDLSDYDFSVVNAAYVHVSTGGGINPTKLFMLNEDNTYSVALETVANGYIDSIDVDPQAKTMKINCHRMQGSSDYEYNTWWWYLTLSQINVLSYRTSSINEHVACNVIVAKESNTSIDGKYYAYTYVRLYKVTSEPAKLSTGYPIYQYIEFTVE